MSFCEHCTQGHALPGEPTGSFQDTGAYFHPAPPSDVEGTRKAVVLLTDAFGLPLKNCKIMADQYSEKLGCDVWVPDMFAGSPPFKESMLSNNFMPETPGVGFSLSGKFRLLWLIITRLPQIISNRPSAIDSRIHPFVKKLREEKKYDKIGAVGFCMGGATAIRLASTGLIDSAVVCHPGRCSPDEIKAIKVPTSWVCAEEDITFGPKLRNEAEAIFAAHKDKPDYLDYEFRDYKGTVHGFAARPNLGIPAIKEGFEKAFDQTVEWFKKTLQ